MVGFGIKGLVGSARRATEVLRTGLTDAERPAFVNRLQRDLRFVDDLLAREGRTEADLPAPSRRAFDVLRRIAELPPSALPTRPEGSAPASRLRVPGAEQLLGRILEIVERGDAAPELVERFHARARAAADAMEASCRAAGGDTASLSERSRRSYAMLRWLSAEDHARRYAEAVALAVRALPRSLTDAGMFAPPETRVRFEPGHKIWSATRCPTAYRWRLSPGYLIADEGDFAALAVVAALRRNAPESAQARNHATLESAAFAATVTEIEGGVDSGESRARGRVHDLDALFARLDETFFRGHLPRPRIEWVPTLSRQRFGYYVPTSDLVCMNPLLDDPAIPAFVVEVVLYHELLHKKHGGRLSKGRCHSHTPEFRAEERLHPRFEEADRVITSLARGASPSSEPPPGPRSLAPEFRKFDVAPPPTPPRALSSPPRPSRNAPCPCGSGRKYKRCHLGQDEASMRPTRSPR